MHTRGIPALILWLALGLSLAGPLGATPAVVASIAPLHSLVAAVMEDVGRPSLLLHGSTSPHSFSLRPSDARVLQRAEVIFWIGPAMERPLARIIANLETTRSEPMLDIDGVERLPRRHLDDHAGHAGAEPHHEDGEPDPHIWLSPINAIAMARHISAVLSELDAANASRYRTNLQRLTTRLQRLDTELAERLGKIGGHFAVFHDAFQYFEARYGLPEAAIVSTHPDRSPGAAHLHALVDRLSDSDARCLFSEPQFPARLVDMLQVETGIRHAVLDPLGASIVPGPLAYEATLRAIADAFLDCMTGDHSGA